MPNGTAKQQIQKRLQNNCQAGGGKDRNKEKQSGGCLLGKCRAQENEEIVGNVWGGRAALQ